MRILAASAALVVLMLPACSGAQETTLAPGTIVATVDTTYIVSGPDHSDTTATSVQSLRRTTRGGVEVWEMAFALHSSTVNMVDTTFFTVGALTPVAQHRWKERQHLEVAFDGPLVRVGRTETGGEPVIREHRFDHPVYAGSMMDIVYRALPLQAGYRTRVPFFLPERERVYWIDVEVVGVEEVRVRGEATRAWRVHADVQNFRDVYWISPDTRALLKVESGDGKWYIR
jgi:hypothetical protein